MPQDHETASPDLIFAILRCIVRGAAIWTGLLAACMFFLLPFSNELGITGLLVGVIEQAYRILFPW